MSATVLKKVIDPIRHERLIQGIDGFAQTAGIPPSFVYKSTREHLTDKEIEWLRHYPKHQAEGEGLMLLGIHTPDPATKMQSMTAAFLRNFKDARLIPVNTVLEMLEDKSMPDCEVLLIPNLYQTAYGKTMPAYKIQALYDLLLGRQASGKVSVVYVQDLDKLDNEYGVLFAGHLKQYARSEGAKI